MDFLKRMFNITDDTADKDKKSTAQAASKADSKSSLPAIKAPSKQNTLAPSSTAEKKSAPGKPKANSEDDWILDSIIQYMKSYKWRHEMDEFLDEKCSIFDEKEEYTHAQFKVHQDYITLVESKLLKMVNELGVDSQKVVAAMEATEGKNPHADLVKYLIAIGDFPGFKNTMALRNAQLEREQKQMSDKEVGLGVREQEARDLQKAIELSKDSYAAELLRLEREQKELMMALAESEKKINEEKKKEEKSTGKIEAEEADKKKKEMETHKADLERRLKDLAELKKVHQNNYMQEAQKEDSKKEFKDSSTGKGETLEERKKRLADQREKLLSMKRAQREQEALSELKALQLAGKENASKEKEQLDAETKKNQMIYDQLKKNHKI